MGAVLVIVALWREHTKRDAQLQESYDLRLEALAQALKANTDVMERSVEFSERMVARLVERKSREPRQPRTTTD